MTRSQLSNLGLLAASALLWPACGAMPVRAPLPKCEIRIGVFLEASQASKDAVDGLRLASRGRTHNGTCLELVDISSAERPFRMRDMPFAAFVLESSDPTLRTELANLEAPTVSATVKDPSTPDRIFSFAEGQVHIGRIAGAYIAGAHVPSVSVVFAVEKRSAVAGLTATLERLGGIVLDVLPFGPDVSLADAVTQALNAGAEVVAVVADDLDFEQVSAAIPSGDPTSLFVIGHMHTPADDAIAHSRNVTLMSVVDNTSPSVRDFLNDYRSAYGREATLAAVRGHDVGKLLLDVFGSSQEPALSDVKRLLTVSDVELMTGPAPFRVYVRRSLHVTKVGSDRPAVVYE